MEGSEVENDVRGISLVAPDETQARRVLKEAVIQGAPVLFAVQMLESATDINLANIPSLSIFQCLHALQDQRHARAPRRALAASGVLQGRDFGEAGRLLRAFALPGSRGGARDGAGTRSGEGESHRVRPVFPIRSSDRWMRRWRPSDRPARTPARSSLRQSERAPPPAAKTLLRSVRRQPGTDPGAARRQRDVERSRVPYGNRRSAPQASKYRRENPAASARCLAGSSDPPTLVSTLN